MRGPERDQFSSERRGVEYMKLRSTAPSGIRKQMGSMKAADDTRSGACLSIDASHAEPSEWQMKAPRDGWSGGACRASIALTAAASSTES